MQQILVVTFPFFALVLCGWGVARVRVLPLEAIPGLNTFVLFFALPCMLYRFAASTPIVKLLDPGVSGLYLLAALLMVGLTIVATKRGNIGWNDASFGALVTAFPNSGFMGVPLLVALLGQRAAGPAIISISIDMVLTTSLCIALSRLEGAGEHGVAKALGNAMKGMLKNPLPWAIALGCLSTATGWQPWLPVKNTIAMLADGASPVALFTIGAVLARPLKEDAAHRSNRFDLPLVVAVKLLLHPALVLGLGKAAQAAGAPLDGFALNVLVMVSALPGASSIPMLAERYGADAGRIARIVLWGTALSFATFTAVVGMLR